MKADGRMTKHFDLAGLIGSRICHDIISPLGAVGNGVELMVLAGQARGPEFDLVRESIESANDRIKFFRVAFGLAAAGQMVSANELAALIRAIASVGRLVVDWPVSGGLQRLEVKRVLLGLLCVEQLLPAGGTVSIMPAEPGSWMIYGAGPRIKDAPHLSLALESAALDDQLAASEVQFVLLRMECEAQERPVKIEIGTGSVSLTA